MKTWKLVSGILSIIFSVFIIIQSCVYLSFNTFSKTVRMSCSAAILFAFILLAGGITSIAVRKGSVGGSIALCILYGIGALFVFPFAKNYSDLYLWSGWSLICAILAIISIIFRNPRDKTVNKKRNRSKQHTYVGKPKDYEMITFQIIVLLGIFFIAVVIGMIIHRSYVPV